jgi:hypothetical protein
MQTQTSIYSILLYYLLYTLLYYSRVIYVLFILFILLLIIIVYIVYNSSKGLYLLGFRRKQALFIRVYLVAH